MRVMPPSKQRVASSWFARHFHRRAPGQQRLAAQQGSEIGDRLDHRASLEAQFLWNLGSAALDPERVQSGGCGAIDVPGIRRDEAKLGVGDLQSLRGQIVDARADFEDLNFLDAD